MNTAHGRSELLNMRLSPEILAMIHKAAALQQQDIAAFVRDAALERSREILFGDRILYLTPREQEQVKAALAKEAQVFPEVATLVAAVSRDQDMQRQDRERWWRGARRDMERLAGEDLTSEPGAW